MPAAQPPLEPWANYAAALLRAVRVVPVPTVLPSERLLLRRATVRP